MHDYKTDKFGHYGTISNANAQTPLSPQNIRISRGRRKNFILPILKNQKIVLHRAVKIKRKTVTKGICKFCGQEKDLIASHIIPKCFYQLKIRGPIMAIRPGSKDSIDKKNYQNGIKEPLMCMDCDNKLGTLDGYTNRILSYAIINHHFQNVDKIKMYLMQTPDFEYNKLRKFFISLVWRASISSESFSLGRYEETALKILKEEIPDDETLFVLIVFRKNTQTAADNITMFATNKYCGKFACLVRFPNYEIAIITNTKYSNNERTMQLYKSMLTPREFLVIETNYITPDDIKIMNAILACQHQLH